LSKGAMVAHSFVKFDYDTTICPWGPRESTPSLPPVGLLAGELVPWRGG